MRKRRKWVENMAIGAIAVLAGVIAFPAGIYLDENAPQWEAPAVFISLGLSVLPVLWYWRIRRFGWVVATLSSVLLMVSFMAALAHGWGNQAGAVLTAAVCIIMVAFFVDMSRTTRQLESAMRAIGEELNGDPLFSTPTLFRDDGQRISVYPRRSRLLTAAVAQVALLAGIGWLFAYLSANDSPFWIAIGLLICAPLLGVLLGTLFRLTIHRPALVVGPDGILDGGALVWSGVGLISWDEILSVTPSTRSAGWVKQHFLDIMVTDLPAIRRRLPLLKRLALFNSYSGMSRVLISQLMLETPTDELASQIAEYVASHAPSGWRDDGAAVGESPLDDDRIGT
jgi:hypothetical protein